MQKKFAQIIIQDDSEREERIVYYILEDENFGIQISKDPENENSKDNELVMHNIVKTRKEAEEILSNLIRNNNDLAQASYIIEDFLKNKKDLDNKTLIS